MKSFFERYGTAAFITVLILSLFSGFLLFDLRLSMGGDDSAYIIRGWDLFRKGAFPTFQGPLYPMFLAPFISIFGLNVGLLKTLSLLFLGVHLFFFHKTFRNRINAAVFWPALIITGINPFILYYGSQTYSEAFFMMLQMIFLWYFLKHFIGLNSEISSSVPFKKTLILSLILLALGLTRSIGYAALIAVVTFFLIHKNWKQVWTIFLSFAGLYVIYQLFTSLIWQNNAVQFSNQASMFSYVDPYNKTLGKETISGYLMRIVDNSNLYLSKHFLRIIGLRAIEAVATIPVLTILIYGLFVGSFALIFKKNKVLVFTALYILFACGVSFVLLQAYWDNDRLIVPFVPLMVLFLFAGIHAILTRLKVSKSSMITAILGLFIAGTTFIALTQKIQENAPILQASLEGDSTYDFEPWRINYLDACQYAADHLPENAVIGARKSAMATIHTGRDFLSIVSVPNLTKDEVFKPNKVYMLVKSLQVHPEFKKYYSDQIVSIIFGYGSTNGRFPANVSYQVYEFSPSEFDRAKANAQRFAVPYLSDQNEFLNSFAQVSCVNPKLLVNTVHYHEMDYLILDQLRLDGKTISAITYKFVVSLNSLYPGALEEVYKTGRGEFEASTIIKIDRNSLK